MAQYDIKNVDLGLVQEELKAYVSMWVAISNDNKIVGSGTTYDEALAATKSKVGIILLKVPPLDASLAPLA
jgi:hypothetical protein